MGWDSGTTSDCGQLMGWASRGQGMHAGEPAGYPASRPVLGTATTNAIPNHFLGLFLHRNFVNFQ